MSEEYPAFLIVTCVVQVLGSALVLLMSAGMLFAPSIVDRSRTPAGAAPHALFYGMATIYGLFAVLGLLTAIGLFRACALGSVAERPEGLWYDDAALEVLKEIPVELVP